jgi:hypothetical protein
VPAIGGLSLTWQRDAALTILHPSGSAAEDLRITNLVVVELPLLGLGYQALIGRDVLSQCRLLYDGPADRFELSY